MCLARPFPLWLNGRARHPASGILYASLAGLPHCWGRPARTPENRQNLPIDIASPVRHRRIMVFGAANQFSLTRAASSTCGRAISKFLSIQSLKPFARFDECIRSPKLWQAPKAEREGRIERGAWRRSLIAARGD